MPSISFDRTVPALFGRKIVYKNDAFPDDDSGLYWTWPVRKFILSRTWVRTPGFNQSLRAKPYRKRNLPMNDFSFYHRVTDNPYDTARVYHLDSDEFGIDYVDMYGSIGLNLGIHEMPNVNLPVPSVDLTLLDNLAKNKSLLDLKDQKVNVWQAFAERGQTIRLIGNTIKRLNTMVTSLKKGNLSGAAQAIGVKASPRRVRKYVKSWHEDASKALANGVLELQYGWRPLLSDIYGSAEQLAQLNVNEIRNISKTSRSRNIFVKKSFTSDENQGGPPTTYVYSRKVTIKYVIYYSTPSRNHTLAQIGLTNPLLIAWELTPWSFVGDWLLPLGDYLKTLDATSGLVFEKGCRTTFDSMQLTGRSRSGGGISRYWESSSTCSTKEITCTRQSLSGFPSANLPSFKNPFSAEHVVNLIALLRTNLKVK